MLERVAAIVGSDAVRSGEEARRWAVGGVVPRVVAAPATTEEAAALLALASEEGWAVEPAGAGGWLGAGRVPERIDLVVTTERMTALVEHEPADLVVTVEAGMPLRELNRRLAPHRQWLPLDPPGREDATVGAAISLAAAGPLREGHGTPRDHVLGMRIVTGDGRVLDLGGKVVKNVAGYDLVKLMIGSRGTLGLITRLHLRLHPLPEADRTLVVGASEHAPLLALLARLREERIETAALELVGGGRGDGASPVVGALLGSGAGSQSAGGVGSSAGVEAADPVSGSAWLLLIRLQGNAEAVADTAERIRRFAQADALPVHEVAAGEADPWAALGAVEADAELSVRLADLPARLGETLELALRLSGEASRATADGRDAGSTLSIAAHAGSGIVRLSAVRAAVPSGVVSGGAGDGEIGGAISAANGGATGTANGTATIAGEAAGGGPALEPDAWAPALLEARAALAERGGTVLLANAPAGLLERVDPFGDVGAELRLMKGLEAQFDPAGVLAPGRFVV